MVFNVTCSHVFNVLLTIGSDMEPHWLPLGLISAYDSTPSVKVVQNPKLKSFLSDTIK